LFFLEEGRRLFGLDADSGRVLWAQWAPAAQVEPVFPGGRFYPRYNAGEEWVVLQTTAGKLLVFDSSTGRRVHEGLTNGLPWRRPPRALDERRICLVPDARHLVLFDPAAGKPAWTCPTRTPSLSARAAQVLGDGKTLLALIDGWQLERLDPRTGRPRWQCAISTEPVDAARAACDETAVYFVSRNVLHARALDDGRSLWQLPLREAPGPWRVVRSHSSLIVLPVKAQQALDRPWTAGGYLMAFPWEVEWRHVPVLLCDPGEGQVVRRLHLPATGPRIAVQAVERGVAIGLDGKTWRIED
jgi:outer membrane protein assembly factor BamB